MRSYLFLITLCLFFPIFSSYAELNASLSESSIKPNEITRLTIKLSGSKLPQNPPDLSPLNKDFRVLGRSQSQSISIINGHTEREVTWHFTLMPTTTGKLTIPPIKVGDQYTSAQTLTVSKIPETQEVNKQEAPIVFLETVIDKKSGYVQSQIHYRVRLYYAENIMNGTLTEPQAAHSVMLRISEDKHYQKQLNHKTYQVLERDYALFPEKSGTLSIQGPEFSGIRTQHDDPFQQFDPFYNTARIPVHLLGEKKEVLIKPIPESIQPSEWLPANKVELSESWQMPEQFKIGQPITRTETLRIYGSTQAQLPDLKQSAIEGLKIYPEEAKTQNLSEDDTIIAEKIQKFTYMPTQAGTFTLPEVTIKWWNVERDQLETTTLPQKEVTILALPQVTKEQTPPTAIPSPFSQKTILPSPVTSTRAHFYAGLFFALWLLTMALWWLQNKFYRGASNKNQQKRAFNSLLKACTFDNPKLIEKRLLAWAKHVWPQTPLLNLTDIMHHINDADLRSEIKFLEAALYGNHPSWSPSALKLALQAFKAEKSYASSAHDQHALKELYPNMK